MPPTFPLHIASGILTTQSYFTLKMITILLKNRKSIQPNISYLTCLTIPRKVRQGLERPTFEQKREATDLFNVDGKLATENGETVVYVKCFPGLCKPNEKLIETLTCSQSGSMIE